MNVCSHNFMGWLQFNSLYFQYKFMKDISSKEVPMKYGLSKLLLSCSWCVCCRFFCMLLLFMWWSSFIKLYLPIKSQTSAMVLLHILINQLEGGMTLGCTSFMPVQYKLLLRGFWFMQRESKHMHFAFFPSVSLWEFVVLEDVTFTTEGINFLVIQQRQSKQQHPTHRPANVLSLDPPPGQSG